MKKLLILQLIGILLFAGFLWLLILADQFTYVNAILIYLLLAVGNVVNAKIMLMKPIEDLSIHDKLTGCHNRTKLASKIPEYEKYANYAVIFFDINNLKKMNDVHGHDDGDYVIIKASNQLRYWYKYGDLYRLGGDEFLVVVPNMPQKGLDKTLESWHEKQPNLNEDYKEDDFICNFSYGIYYKTKTDKKSFNDIMNSADENMYTMKNKIKEEDNK